MYIMMLTCCYVLCYLQSPGKEGMDVYDTLLTQAEIQGNINQVNDVIRKKKAEEACKFVEEEIITVNLFCAISIGSLMLCTSIKLR